MAEEKQTISQNETRDGTEVTVIYEEKEILARTPADVVAERKADLESIALKWGGCTESQAEDIAVEAELKGLIAACEHCLELE
jgi:hypothetical protein